MTRYQFLNIETFHLISADAKDAAWQLGLDEAPVVDATRDVNFGSPATILRRRPNLRGPAAFELTQQLTARPGARCAIARWFAAPSRSGSSADH